MKIYFQLKCDQLKAVRKIFCGSVRYPLFVMSAPLLIEANKALRSSAPESPPPLEGPLKSMGGGGGPGGGGGGHPPAGALGAAAEAEAMAP